MLQRALKERIEGQKYDPVKGSQVGCIMMKDLELPRAVKCTIILRPPAAHTASETAGR